MKKRAVFNWSGGKDSALALYHTLKNEDVDIVNLLTSINVHHGRVSMHGVRQGLLEKQAASIGIPLVRLLLPEPSDMATYNHLMGEVMKELKENRLTLSVFGDIFLEDLRKYREDKLKPHGFEALFPLWGRDTKVLLREFLELGFKTIVVCVKSDLLDKSFAGRVIDESFIEDLPGKVDPCGENGEFHTFVFDGPIFREPILFDVGDIVFRSYEDPEKDDASMGFWFCDLIPKNP